MFNSVLNRLKSKQRFQIVEVHFTSDDLFLLKIVKETKQGVNSVFESCVFNSFEAFKREINTDIPIIIFFNGKGIVYKKIPSSINVESLKEVLPGISPDDYYFEQMENNNGQFFSVVRKEKLNNVIDLFADNNLNVVSIFIGYLFLNDLSRFGIVDGKILIDSNTELAFERGYLSTVGKKSESENKYINELEIDNVAQHVDFLCYLTIRSLGEAEYYMNSSQHSIVSKNCIAYFEKSTLRKVSWYFSVCILVVVLVIFCLNIYQSNSLKNSNLSNISNYNEKEDRFIVQKKIINSLKWNDDVRHSVYLDIIGTSVPSNIYLMELEFNSFVGKGENAESIENKNSEIIDVKGIAKKSYDLNVWINTLKNESWVKGIVLKDFRKLDSQKSEFNMLIEIN